MNALDQDLSARARRLMSEAIVWDNHGCMPFEHTERFLPQLIRYRNAGASVATINIGDSNIPLDVLVKMAARIRHFVQSHPEDYILGLSVADIKEAKRSGRLAVILDIEGLWALGDEIALIELFYGLGVRWALFIYNKQNLVGSGCHDEVDNGLTQLGRRFAAEMDRVGMIKCCSHTGYRTARDILEFSARPVIFSHSNARTLRDHPRNIPDELIKGCAATGGVVGINGVGIFLGDNDASAEAIVRHVDHVAQLVGAKHVGFGLDYVFNQPEMDQMLVDNAGLWPPQFGYRPGIKFAAPEILPEVCEALAQRGYSDDAVRGILGGNLLRVAETVWR